MRILEKINKANDIRNLRPSEYEALADQIREFLIEHVSRTGGHLASNLGVVELTMALHLFLDFPKDKLIWDVGHQCYVHKILTGRADGFEQLRKYGGMSGFPKRRESNTDLFDSGHSSNSISEACGLVRARELTGGKEKVVAVIGDGALTGGLAYEGLNNAGQLKSNLILVLNDNEMSIAKNVGGMASYLGKIRTSTRYEDLKDDVTSTLEKIPLVGEKLVRQIRRSKESLKQFMIPGMFFEQMNITYVGPIDGHNIGQMYEAFLAASRKNGPVLVHVITKKGKGYDCAEHDPGQFHGVDAFDVETGKSLSEKQGDTYTDVFAAAMNELAAKYRNLVAITAAMPDGTGLSEFKTKYPRRFFDVGIAEGHAVTFAAGLAAAGLKPIVAVYSSFLQRAYDQILHDVCIQDLPVVFAIDRAGLVGSDGETHQGIFDLSYLSTIPNMAIMAPKNKWELSDMVKFAMEFPHPVAIRYPRGEAYDGLREYRSKIDYGKSEQIREGSQIALIALGSMVKTALEVERRLEEQGYCCTLINARFAKPLDTEMLGRLAASHQLLVTLEENVASGGFGEHVAQYLSQEQKERLGQGLQVLTVAVPDVYVEHGNVEILRKELGIDSNSVVERILGCCGQFREAHNN